MKQYRFFVSPDQIRNHRVTLTADQARQIYSVLRMRESQQIIVLDNRGWQYDVRLEKITPDLVLGEVVSRVQALAEPQTRITLYQAFLKKDNFEWVLQKGTEIGVSEFVPLITERCVVRHNKLKPAKVQRWQRIISEAAEQSGRGRLPTLASPLSLADALAETGRFDASLIPWVGESEKSLAETLKRHVASEQARIALLIGPEGGFSDDEIDKAAAAGVHTVTLGSRILRAETAAIVASTLSLATLNDI